METADTVRTFWFGTQSDDALVAKEQSALWWNKDEHTDELIRERFEALTTAASRGELDTWRTTVTGRLALILLTDQFPRNMYRNTPKAFSFDPLALSWCKEGLRENMHEVLRPIERVFFYLPLEHSESGADQDMSVRLFEELLEKAEPEARATFEGFLDYAIQHRDIIARFDRFPHRNQILGRQSSPEEITFLSEKGSSF
jgi:uncharacterized protein (DUF924 family)